MLTAAYLKNGWSILALTMGRRALAQDPGNEKAAEIQKMLTGLEPIVTEQVSAMGLDGTDGLECLTMHDQVRSLLAQGRYAQAAEVAEQLAQRRPRFAPAYNNGAEAAFHDGRLAQAIVLEERLLAGEPDNVFARANLVRFLVAAGKREEACRHADRLKVLEVPVKDLAIKQAEALAWLGDDEGVLAVFERGRDLNKGEAPQDDAMLYHLAAVAAYHQGRERDARSYWRLALEAVPDFDMARANLADLDRPIGERNAPWSYSFVYFVPRKLIDGLLTRLTSARGPDKEEAVRRKAQRYLEAHPELEALVPLLLEYGDRVGRELALNLTEMLRTPGMLQAVRDFALGQRGSDTLRVRAVQLASEAGLLPSSSIRLWMEGQWRTVLMQQTEITTEAIEHHHAPGVYDLLAVGVAALGDGNATRAEQVLRQALAIDPDDAMVLNNLAVACAQQGRRDESEALTIRMYERHPDYLFARTAMANLAVERGQLERARELLEPLTRRPRLHGRV